MSLKCTEQRDRRTDGQQLRLMPPLWWRGYSDVEQGIGRTVKRRIDQETLSVRSLLQVVRPNRNRHVELIASLVASVNTPTKVSIVPEWILPGRLSYHCTMPLPPRPATAVFFSKERLKTPGMTSRCSVFGRAQGARMTRAQVTFQKLLGTSNSAYGAYAEVRQTGGEI